MAWPSRSREPASTDAATNPAVEAPKVESPSTESSPAVAPASTEETSAASSEAAPKAESSETVDKFELSLSLLYLSPSSTTMTDTPTTPEQEKELGEALFVKVQQLEPETARQITDKLVESLEGTEISYILHDETLLKVKIAEVLVELQTP